MRPLRQDQLRGSFAPLVTPFAHGAVDDETFVALIEWHAAQGSHGIVVGAPSIGEPGALTTAERRRLAATAVEVAACRMEVLIATASASASATAELIDHAAADGVDGVIVALAGAPRRSADPVAEIAELARRTELPVLVHRDDADLSVDIRALRKLTACAENIVGVQQSTFDLGFVTEARTTFGHEFRILADVDEMTYFMLAAGAHGCVNPIANVVPGWVAELYYAVAKDGFDEGRSAHHRLYELNRAARAADQPRVIKRMMSQRGLLPGDGLTPLES